MLESLCGAGKFKFSEKVMEVLFFCEYYFPIFYYFEFGFVETALQLALQSCPMDTSNADHRDGKL